MCFVWYKVLHIDNLKRQDFFWIHWRICKVYHEDFQRGLSFTTTYCLRCTQTLLKYKSMLDFMVNQGLSQGYIYQVGWQDPSWWPIQHTNTFAGFYCQFTMSALAPATPIPRRSCFLSKIDLLALYFYSKYSQA